MGCHPGRPLEIGATNVEVPHCFSLDHYLRNRDVVGCKCGRSGCRTKGVHEHAGRAQFFACGLLIFPRKDGFRSVVINRRCQVSTAHRRFGLCPVSRSRRQIRQVGCDRALFVFFRGRRRKRSDQNARNVGPGRPAISLFDKLARGSRPFSEGVCCLPTGSHRRSEYAGVGAVGAVRQRQIAQPR